MKKPIKDLIFNIASATTILIRYHSWYMTHKHFDTTEAANKVLVIKQKFDDGMTIVNYMFSAITDLKYIISKDHTSLESLKISLTEKNKLLSHYLDQISEVLY